VATEAEDGPSDSASESSAEAGGKTAAGLILWRHQSSGAAVLHNIGDPKHKRFPPDAGATFDMSIFLRRPERTSTGAFEARISSIR
jgi:hypothetical protein